MPAQPKIAAQAKTLTHAKSPAQAKAKVFQNGRSQAVRIPAQFRFKTDHVYLEHDPEKGTLTLSEQPTQKSRAERLREIFKEFDEAGGADWEFERDMSPEPERELF